MKYDIVMRCLNEARWLGEVKEKLDSQTLSPEKIVFVDSGSTDGSVEMAEEYGWKVVRYMSDRFNFSESLNIGFENASSELVLILSAHCVPVDESAAENLAKEFEDESVGGVYGRQLPTLFSNPHDTRDLLTVFGRERVTHREYPFFHNAFAMVRHECWRQVPFDERVNGIEDRIWAREIVRRGYVVVYQPLARVFHEHGLNHGTSEERANRVVEALKVYHADEDIEWPS